MTQCVGATNKSSQNDWACTKLRVLQQSSHMAIHIALALNIYFLILDFTTKTAFGVTRCLLIVTNSLKLFVKTCIKLLKLRNTHQPKTWTQFLSSAI